MSDSTTPTLKSRGIYIISGSFNQKLAENVITWILESNFEEAPKYKHLNLVINSEGGEVSSAFAIIDAMRGSALPVHTTGLGQIASCGLLTFIAGAKGHRVLTPNTSILSHTYTWGSYGKEHELFATVREFELTTERMVNHYKKCTGLSEKIIREKLLPPQDIYLSATEAKALNICDHVKDMK